MTAEEFAKELSGFLNKLDPESEISENWKYLSKTSKSYIFSNSKNNEIQIDVFELTRSRLLIRNSRGKILDWSLTKKFINENNNCKLNETFSLNGTGRGHLSADLVKKAFKDEEVETKEIISFDPKNFNWKTIINDILNWMVIREKVKIKLSEQNSGQNSDAISDKKSTITQGNQNSESKNPMKNQPKNQILYGPPGTGKTYNTINKALEIINPEFKTNQKRKIVKAEFDKYIANAQIAFTTFHQSFSYEQFVEGMQPLKPVGGDEFVKYDVVPGIFKKICRKALKNTQTTEDKILDIYNQFNINSNFYKISVQNKEFTVDEKMKYFKSVNKIGIEFKEEFNISKIKSLVEFGNKYSNEKSYNVFRKYFETFIETIKNDDIIFLGDSHNQIVGVARITGDTEYIQNSEVGINHFRKVEWIYKDEPINSLKVIKQDLHPQLVSKLNIQHIFENKETKPHVLIIDEINRGNISKIFGELITLIEDDKRLGEDNEIIVTLPYSGEHFGVPPNLYIIGTMNTADRSLVQLDTALRRRFDFEEMLPSYDEKIWTIGIINGFDLRNFLKKLNDKIIEHYDREHQIGHSYLMNVKDEKELKRAWENKIMPLLQEYFYGNLEDLANVIGKGSEYLKTIGNDSNLLRLNMKVNDSPDYLTNFNAQFKEIYNFVLDIKSVKMVEKTVNPTGNVNPS